MSNIIKINNKDLQVKEFNGQRVVTFKDIDMLHERVDGTANKRFLDNLKHFEKGTDYFELYGDELREIKQLPNFGIGLNANKVILITESGYLMLVKSLQDDLAWKVQRELVNGYFRTKVDPYQGLSKELKAVFLLDEKTQKLEKKVDNLESNLPLFNVECKELQALVRKIGTNALGGYKSPAYENRSVRTKVYTDIQHQLKREFGVERYEAIKRSDLSIARKIVEEYKAPTILINQIEAINRQIGFES